MSEGKGETRRQIQTRINSKLDTVGSRAVAPGQAIALHQGVLNSGESREATYDEELGQYFFRDPDHHKRGDFFHKLNTRRAQKRKQSQNT